MFTENTLKALKAAGEYSALYCVTPYVVPLTDERFVNMNATRLALNEQETLAYEKALDVFDCLFEFAAIVQGSLRR